MFDKLELLSTFYPLGVSVSKDVMETEKFLFVALCSRSKVDD